MKCNEIKITSELIASVHVGFISVILFYDFLFIWPIITVYELCKFGCCGENDVKESVHMFFGLTGRCNCSVLLSSIEKYCTRFIIQGLQV